MKSALNSFKIHDIVSPEIVRAPHQIDVQFHNCFCHVKTLRVWHLHPPHFE